MKRVFKIAIIAIIIIAGLGTGLFFAYKQWFDPYRGTGNTEQSQPLDFQLTQEQALEEMDIIIKRLKERHPACMDEVPQAVLDQYATERAVISENPDVLQVWRAYSRILAKMGDAHTSVWYYQNSEALPLTFEYANGELVCTAEQYAGFAVQSINGTSIDEIRDTFLRGKSYELESYADYSFQNVIAVENWQRFCKIDTSGGVDIVFATPDGEISEHFDFAEPQQQSQPQQQSFVSYDIDKAKSLGIFTLKQCNYNDEYIAAVKAFFEEVNAANIQTIAVDLRGNSGGNSMVANEFIRYLNVDKYYVYGGVDVRFGPYLHKNKRHITTNNKAEPQFNGKVYALTSPNTFSSAADFACMLSDNGIGEIIGDIPGGMPASYGDILTFNLPYSKINLVLSHKYFGRIDETKADLPLIPDHQVKSDNAIEKLHELL